MKLHELRAMSKEELEKRLEELRGELVKLRAQAKTGAAPKNTMQIRNTRREIARILTLLKNG